MFYLWIKFILDVLRVLRGIKLGTNKTCSINMNPDCLIRSIWVLKSLTWCYDAFVRRLLNYFYNNLYKPLFLFIYLFPDSTSLKVPINQHWLLWKCYKSASSLFVYVIFFCILWEILWLQVHAGFYACQKSGKTNKSALFWHCFQLDRCLTNWA